MYFLSIIALGIVLLGGASSCAADLPPGLPFLQFLNAPEQGLPLTEPPRLSVSFGGRPVGAVMDTGSTGVVVAAHAIPNWDQLRRLGPARLTYSSSGRIMEGWWVETRMAIAGRDGATVQTEPMPVMAVTRIACLPGARHCRETTRPRHVAMLGIGFARQADHQAQSTPDHNPFLRLADGASNVAHRGYIVTRRGVMPAVDAVESAFQIVPLSRSPVFPDWAAAPVCLAVDDHVPPACGTVLVDTGVAKSFLTLPTDQLNGNSLHTSHGIRLRPGTPVTVRLGPEASAATPLSYTFRVRDRTDPVAPSDVILVRPGKVPVFINTSVHFLNGFDYLFDADRGLVGFRPSPLQPRQTE